MNLVQKIAFAFIVLLLSASCFAAETEIRNSSEVQGVRANIVVEGTGQIKGDLKGNTAEIEALSFKDFESQTVISLIEVLEINGKQISGQANYDEWGNRYALFKVNETGNFKYRIETVVETSVELPNLEDFDLDGGITGHQEYLDPTKNIQSNHESIRTVALNRFQSNSWLETIVEVTKWTYDNVEYDLSYVSGVVSAVDTLKNKKGVCDEFAGLAGAMLRAKGIPARVVTGYSFNPKEGEGWERHGWVEAFNPGVGWIPLDPTFFEAGVVDGTHIITGIYPDLAESSGTKVRSVQTAPINIGDRTMDVEVVSVELFDKIFAIDAGNLVMPANKWNEVSVSVTNGLQRKVIGWFILSLPKEFSLEDQRRLVLFQPGEEKTLEWKTRVDMQLKENEYLHGDYAIVALGERLENEFKVMPGENFNEEAEVKLIDLVPIVEQGNLVLEATLENLGQENATVSIEIEGSVQEFEIGSFERQKISLSVTGIENRDYAIAINGPGLEYETVITVHEGIPFAQPQTIPPAAQPNSTVFDGLAEQLFSFEGAVMAGIVVGLVVVGLLLKALLSR